MKLLRKIIGRVYVCYATLLFVVMFLCLLPFLFLVSLYKRNAKKIIFSIIRFWSIIWTKAVGINIEVEGKEKVKQLNNKNCIVIVNHASYLDIVLIFRVFDFPVLSLAKIEMARIPLFGWLYKQMTILVDRSSKASKQQSFEKMAASLYQGHSILIFPEGTFDENSGVELKEFRHGAFKLAAETGTPILPVVFENAYKIWHASSFWSLKPGKCKVKILAPEYLNKDNWEVQKDKLASAMQEILAD